MPFPFIPPIAAGAGWLARQMVKYAWGPMVSGIGHLFKSRLGLFIGGAFLWLGINFTTIKIVMEPAIQMLVGLTESVGTGGTGEFAAAAASYVGIMQLDRGISMIVSAVVAKHVVMQGRLFLFRRGVGA